MILPSVSLLLGLPFMAFLCLWSGGSRSGKWAGPAAVLVTSAGLISSIFLAQTTHIQQFAFEWVKIDGISISLSFRIDSLTNLMLPLVHFVALLVQIYSIAYMKGDKAVFRYFAFLQLFVFSMLGIVLASDLIVMYIFWELVGLSSYLLIGFWYHKPRAVWAAKKAFILNRIGDAAFLSGILILIFKLGSVNLSDLSSSFGTLSDTDLTLIGLLLFGGCVGKSAQFPLSGWLPDAMEGPTPVSALIHAATMVAAGIFLLARISFLLTPTAQMTIAVIGMITMLDGSIKASREWDIKRVLAYSTISQLGLMVFAIGIGSWQIALFHLLTHAFFKAGLFLSAGSVIHSLTPSGADSTFNPQDMRNMGGLKQKLPLTYLCYLACSAALAGLPLFSGFLSKDAIFIQGLSKAQEPGGGFYLLLTGLAIAAAGLTAYYMTRQIRLIFLGNESDRLIEAGIKPHESPAMMWVPMGILAVLSLFFWFSWNPFDGSAGWLLSKNFPVALPHAVWVPLISVAVTLGGIYAGFRLSAYFSSAIDRIKRWPHFNWLINFEASLNHHVFFLAPFLNIAKFLAKIETRVIDYGVDMLARLTVIFSHLIGWVDRGIVDGAVRLTVLSVKSSGALARQAQNGKIQVYFIITVISMLLIVAWLFLLV